MIAEAINKAEAKYVFHIFSLPLDRFLYVRLYLHRPLLSICLMLWAKLNAISSISMHLKTWKPLEHYINKHVAHYYKTCINNGSLQLTVWKLMLKCWDSWVRSINIQYWCTCIDGRYRIYVARLRNGGKIRFSTYL